MPRASQRGTVRNFSGELNRRPAEFVDRPPPPEGCSICGIVVRGTILMLCGHRLCGTCDLRLLEMGGPPCCPLDGDASPEEDGKGKTFPAGHSDRAVYCWNKDNGCKEILARSKLSEHFFHNCRHHVVACPKCSTEVLRNSLGVHLRSCPGHREEEGAQVPGDGQQTAETPALKTELSSQQAEQQLGDLKGPVDQPDERIPPRCERPDGNAVSGFGDGNIENAKRNLLHLKRDVEI